MRQNTKILKQHSVLEFP